MKSQPRYRTIRKDGSLNIIQPKGVNLKDLYHDLLKATWPEFICMFTAVFFFLNCTFGLIYFLIPSLEYEGFRFESGFQHYLECFFFSVQTFGTIGYGRVSPIGIMANSVVTLECYTSLFIVAVLTGIIFARFARPSVKVMFSNRAVVRNFDEIPCLMFRVANARMNYISDARVRVSLAIDDPKSRFRNFYDLKLERESSPIFAMSWTIAHDIDDSSPLFGLNENDWISRNGELVVTFSGTDTTLSQMVYAKTSYVIEEILYNHDFVDVLARSEDGSLQFMPEKFHWVQPMEEKVYLG